MKAGADFFPRGCLSSLLLALLVAGVGPPEGRAAKPAPPASRLNLFDSAAVRARAPLLIAHRGGVVTPSIPECSLAAIRAASAANYDLVELDLRETKDAVPVVFHDRDLRAACGREGTIAELTAAEVRALRYRQNGEPVANLDDALALCVRLGLGVMIDFKDPPQREGVARVAGLVRRHGLEKAAMTISAQPVVREELGSIALVPVNSGELRRVAAGEAVALAGRFWFGIPSWIDWKLIPQLRQAGALVIPAINTFRYENDPGREQARRDVQQLSALGVEGFQIDSAYQDFFNRPPVGEVGLHAAPGNAPARATTTNPQLSLP